MRKKVRKLNSKIACIVWASNPGNVLDMKLSQASSRKILKKWANTIGDSPQRMTVRYGNIDQGIREEEQKRINLDFSGHVTYYFLFLFYSHS